MLFLSHLQCAYYPETQYNQRNPSVIGLFALQVHYAFGNLPIDIEKGSVMRERERDSERMRENEHKT